MKLDTLKERIQNATEKVAKKQNTIAKKTASIAKKTASLSKLGQQEREWAETDIEDLKYDIERLQKEIAETEKTIENYRKQLSGEIEKQSLLTKEIPENMKKMQNDLVEGWDAYDKQRKEEVRKAYSELGYRKFFQIYTGADYELIDKTEKQIHESNVRDAEKIVLNLINRVKEITGEITSWAGIRATVGTWGYTVLNGIVVGKEGRCEVESIGAGGYNVQKYHIRVLVKPC